MYRREAGGKVVGLGRIAMIKMQDVSCVFTDSRDVMVS